MEDLLFFGEMSGNVYNTTSDDEGAGERQI